MALVAVAVVVVVVNCSEYEKLKQETSALIKKGGDEGWLSEFEKLHGASENEKWKILNKSMSQAVTSGFNLFEGLRIMEGLGINLMKRIFVKNQSVITLSYAEQKKVDESIQPSVEKHLYAMQKQREEMDLSLIHI